MKTTIIILFCIACFGLWSEINWQHVCFSGVNAESMRGVRVQASGQAPSVIIKNGGLVNSVDMEFIPGTDMDYWALINNPDYPFIGLRQDSDTTNIIIPVFHNSTSTPAINDLTPVASDPAGDAMFTNLNLDITNTYVSSGPDKFYFGIQNNGGGFPVSSGFTFFSYMAVIIDPATLNDPDPVIWGLMYTIDIAGVISPGLYRITGQAIGDMTRLGDIETQILAGDNLLVMSCDKSDLMADPSFSAWYSSANPEFAGSFMTNNISLSEGVLVADLSLGYRLIDIQLPVPQDTATAPMLTNATMQLGLDSMLHFDIDYFSFEAYFPLTYDVIIDNQQHYPMAYSGVPDWSGTVHYSAAVNPLEIEGWSTASLVFSADNISYSDTTFTNTANDDQVNSAAPVKLIRRVYPNPASGKLNLDFNQNYAEVKASLYNLKGQKILMETVRPVQGKARLDLQALQLPIPSGIYILQLASENKSDTVKIVIME